MYEENLLSGQQMLTCFESNEQRAQSVRPYHQVDHLQSCHNHHSYFFIRLTNQNTRNQDTHCDQGVNDVCNFQTDALTVTLHDDVLVCRVDATVKQILYVYRQLQIHVAKHPVHVRIK